MQEEGDRPVRPGRPSLLSTGPQAEPERQRILSSLDGTGAKPAGKPAAKPAAAASQAPQGRSRGLVWGALGLGALVVGAVVFALTSAGGDTEPVLASAPAQHVPDHAAVAAPTTPPAPAAPVAAQAEAAGANDAAPLAALTASATPEPSTAAILNDVAEAPANPLADMAPPPRHAVAKKADAKEKPGRKAEAKAEQPRLAQQKAKEKSPSRPARSAADSDVVLLSALMAHIQPANRKATPAEQLKVCKQYNAAGEAQCRVRVCEAAGLKEPACKDVPVAKLAPET